MKTNPKDAAFATPEVNNEHNATWYGQKGLTKLEYFAGLAMQGCIASGVDYDTKEDVSKIAVAMAKALITQLNKEQ